MSLDVPWFEVFGLKFGVDLNTSLGQKQFRVLSQKVHPDKLSTNFAFMDTCSGSELASIRAICERCQVCLNKGKESMDVRVNKRKLQSDAIDWSNFIYTAYVFDFNINNRQQLVMLGQLDIEDISSKYFITNQKKLLYEYSYVNGIKFYVADYKFGPISFITLAEKYKQHLRHFLTGRRDGFCVLCKYGIWDNLKGREDAIVFFQKMRTVLSTTKARNLVTDLDLSNNDNRELNHELIAFNNGYFHFMHRKVYTSYEMDSTEWIAVCNQLEYALPEEFLGINFTEMIENPNFFDYYINKIPTLRDLFYQPRNITKVRRNGDEFS